MTFHPVINEVKLELINSIREKQNRKRKILIPKGHREPINGYDVHKLKQVQQIIKDLRR